MVPTFSLLSTEPEIVDFNGTTEIDDQIWINASMKASSLLQDVTAKNAAIEETEVLVIGCGPTGLLICTESGHDLSK